MVAVAPYLFQIETFSACVLNLRKDFKDPSPIIFTKSGYNSKYNLLLPSKVDGTVCLNTTDEILMVCPDSTINAGDIKSATKGSIHASCFENIEPAGRNRKKSNSSENLITCNHYPKPHAKRTSSETPCPRSFHKYTIDVTHEGDNLINTLTMCYEPNYLQTFYVKHTLYPQIKGAQSAKRPNRWTEEKVYNLPIPLDKLYKKKAHHKTINAILGLEPNSLKYINPDEGDNFLSKGHLSPKADHIYGTAQSLTFHYLNSAPQWMSFNSGNWLTLERQVRNFCAKRTSELIVYTGTHGICTLPSDINGKEQELYLYVDENNNKAIPVPKYFWKIIYDPASRQGIAFIGVNNPFYFNKKSDVLCKDICHQINWPENKNAHNVTRGYFYCCDVNDLRKSIPNLPYELKVDELLD